MSQKKAKFNFVDIIVILILIAGIAFVGMRLFGGQESAEAANTGSYLLTFRSDCVPEEIAATLTADSAAKDNGRNIALGTLVEVTTGESVTYGYDSKGRCVASEKPGHVSVTLVCRVSGSREATGLMVDRNLLSIGSELDVSCGTTQVRAVLWTIAPEAGE